MYLKRLELCGFKSFADKTKLEFEPGISGIVGPNGCGKSNISDAIRWCLGEQSARSMRSTQMLDIIFSGSQSRSTTGLAEVSLTFDNSQNILPIDYSEITVTRRIFRSGESEYFINKAQCRLKDIRDLFLDTGMGAEGYSVIEQGKVEFLLAAKPEERRDLFEEAAGVSKYKVRREETLRKLQKVEIDMNRVGDMLSLLKEQIGALDIAARKARQYQKHKDDLRRMEIALLFHQIAGAKNEIARIKNDLEPKIQSFEMINVQLNQIEADLSGLRVSHIEKDESYIKIQDEFSKIKSEINLSDERIHNSEIQEEELKIRKDNLIVEIEAMSSNLNQNEQELNKIQTLWNKLIEKVRKLEQEYKEKEALFSGISSRIAEYQHQDNEAKTEIFNLVAEKTNQHNEKNRLISQKMHCEAQISSIEKNLTKLKDQRLPLFEEITLKENQFKDFNGRISQSQMNRDRFSAQILDIEKRLQKKENQKATLKENMISIESKRRAFEELAAKDPAIASIRSVMSLNLTGIKGSISSLIQIDPGSENIVAAALGEKLNYVVADTVETAQSAIRNLEENNFGRATFLVLDRLPENIVSAPIAQPALARTILSMIRYAQSIEKALRFICGETMVQGRSIYGYAIIQGGSEIVFEKPLFIEEQIKSLNLEFEISKQNLENTQQETMLIGQELASLTSESKTLELEYQRMKVEFEFLQKQLNSQNEDLQYLDKEIELTEKDIESQKHDKEQIDGQLAAVEASLCELQAREENIRRLQLEIETNIRTLRDEETAMLPLVTESKVAWATGANELSSRKREEQRLKETIAYNLQHFEQSRKELSEIEMKITEQLNIRQTEAAKLLSSNAQVKEKETQLEEILLRRQNLLEQIESKNSSIHSLREQIDASKQEIHSLEIEQRGFQLQKQSFERRLTGEYSQNPAETAHEFLQMDVNEEEIQRIRRKIESMGAVNLAAPEEYSNLEERYDFLLNQQQDLLKAKEDLHQVIAKINHNTRENFKETFIKVRDNFRNIFRQLFEGGEADLVLTDENNLLETGIDIMVQPPGKKLQNMTLLSGGERALTAIALLFAFFMVKPSPFCILDEVDAPLDDANIGRYTNMIKNFSAESQFLVITHNKRTMEMADILYGVTMEELGVSKIISVRLNPKLAVTA